MRRALAWIGAAIGVGLAAYPLFVRRWMLTWGSSTAERHRDLPGDDLVPDPRYEVTRGITVEASPEQVWPWIAQIGAGRGGFYGYPWLDDEAADTIRTDLQDLEVGDRIHLTPEGAGTPLRVERVERPHSLVLASPGQGPRWAWAFVLEPTGPGHTRLLTRVRADWQPGVATALVNRVLMEPAHFLIERRLLLGIKERAEGPRGQVHPFPAREAS